VLALTVTVFGTVMITLSGLVGVCLLPGAAGHYQQGFQVRTVRLTQTSSSREA
jgi:Ca2+/H+ antiporter